MKLLLALAALSTFAGCATTQSGNETSVVRHGLSRIAGDAKASVPLTGGIWYDAKEIRKILNR
jgi:hypothetical protein